MTSRLLLASGPGAAEHVAAHGPLPQPRPAGDLIEEVAAAGLTGRGGAGFPVASKLRAVRAGERPVVVANGAEGEPASSKDRVLLARAPHLVLDGLALAADAVGAGRALIYVHEGPAVAAVRRALAERSDRCPAHLVTAPARFVAGEESAVVSRLSGRAPLPRSKPPMVYASGVDGRPTLVQNVETLAHLALIVRHGAAWFRRAGTAAEPGTMLCTVSGAVAAPGVVEVAVGERLTAVLGGSVRAVLVGGYHGTWVRGGDLTHRRLSAASLSAVDARPGAGVLVVLGDHECPLRVSARVADYLARQSARQCGPCLNGLPAMASSLRAVAGVPSPASAAQRVLDLTGLVAGRGACHHPDGSARFVRSTVTVFADEVAAHADGRCSAAEPAP